MEFPPHQGFSFRDLFCFATPYSPRICRRDGFDPQPILPLFFTKPCRVYVSERSPFSFCPNPAIVIGSHPEDSFDVNVRGERDGHIQ